MQQPSAQGIASLFRGNPAPLQQRIQQEQQGKPGLPPDLQKLLALNIVTNEKDAVAKQQAMDQLAQMQGPQGQPPTVMQTVQEQARQKMQAQAVQAQQQQQGLQALMQQAPPGPVPEGTQFAEAQPQGIDDLPVEFGLAGGGIVAFQKGGDEGEKYETRIDKLYRKNRGELTEEERADAAAREPRVINLPKGTPADEVELIRMQNPDAVVRTEDEGSKLRDIGQAIKRGLTYSSDVEAMKKRQQPPAAQPPADIPQMTSPQPTEQSYRRVSGDSGVRPPVSDLKALAEADARKKQAARPPAPVAQTAAPAAPVAPSVSITPPISDLQAEAQALDVERMRADPQAGAANKEIMYGSRVGPYDTTQRDAMIKQLQEERARQVGPQDSFGQLMEYLGQIAATPRGMSSFEAGAAGARGVRGLEEQRAQKRFDLGSKIIEQEQGKLDGARAYAKELYGVGEKEFDRLVKEKYDAVKSVDASETEKRKLAQQEALKTLELQQQATLDRERMQNQLKVANIGQTRERNEQDRINKITSLRQQARRLEATDPEAAAELMAQATDLEMAAGRGSGTAGVGADNAQTRKLRDAVKDIDSRLEFMDPNSPEFVTLQAQRDRLSKMIIERAIGEAGAGGGSAFTVTAGGKTYTFPTQEAANKFKAEAGVK